MGKTGRVRSERSCDICAQVSAVLYRISTQQTQWRFACPDCQRALATQLGYQYGGTWKQKKRH